ncbi:fungal-specific transcription factor domain-containing protein [Ilyonectria sp. MPI-CAGE-AT-0026]|nr:fungal-specific transcription factor domain-containing protein [Ilyonectria sp. MPI-CAGE-AT-0026]
MACKNCRARKIRCDQTRPVCHNCRLRSSQCTYAGERRIRRRTHGDIVGHRPSLTNADTNHPPMLSAMPLVPLPPVSISEDDGQNDDGQLVCGTNSSNHGNTVNTGARGSHTYDTTIVVQTLDNPDDDYIAPILDRILDADDGEHAQGGHPALWIRAEDGDEYTGPSSGVSIVSDLGLDWIRNHIPDSDGLCETIQDIRNTILAQLRQPKCISQAVPCGAASRAVHGLQPTSPAVVKKYVDAYFSTVQTIFPVLDRQQFETQLATFGTDPNCKSSSWKALLSAVLASGCRAALSNETTEAFQQSGRESWEYFRVALSYEPEILHGTTDLVAVQAFAVLTIFAQGLSCPQRLEFTLCSIASRLAQSIGLYHHPSQKWNLSEEEKFHRARVFWVIYCLDKTIALRCGRPSAINDDEISVGFPQGVQMSYHDLSHPAITDRGQEFDFFRTFTKLTRICGAVSRRLYSATALSSSSAQLSTVFDRLLADLEEWKQAIPTEIQPERPPGRIADSKGPSRFQLLVLHCSYYYVLCAIYRRFTPLFTQNENAQPVTAQSTMKRNIGAARSMALLTKHLDVESLTPTWLGFYYPFTALTTIFVHVVSNPDDESTRNDIALMEVIVGFFGRLEYITSGEAAFTKATEFIHQARRIADRYDDGRRSDSRGHEPRGRGAVNQDHPLDNLSEMDFMSLDVTFEPQTRENQVSSTLSNQPFTNGSLRDILGQQLEPIRQHAAEPIVGNNRQWDSTSSPDISSRILFSDVMSLLENNQVDNSDESWLETWVATGLTGK